MKNIRSRAPYQGGKLTDSSLMTYDNIFLDTCILELDMNL